MQKKVRKRCQLTCNPSIRRWHVEDCDAKSNCQPMEQLHYEELSLLLPLISECGFGLGNMGFIYMLEFGISVNHVINYPCQIKATKLDISTGLQ